MRKTPTNTSPSVRVGCKPMTHAERMKNKRPRKKRQQIVKKNRRMANRKGRQKEDGGMIWSKKKETAAVR